MPLRLHRAALLAALALAAACTHHQPAPAPPPAPQESPVPGARAIVWPTTRTAVQSAMSSGQTAIYSEPSQVPIVLRDGLPADLVDWGSQRLVVSATHHTTTGIEASIDRVVYFQGQTLIHVAQRPAPGEVGLLKSLIVFAAVPNDGTPAQVVWR